ncbi:MAG: winged helix-turn-helix transcriptional regulator [Chloroflexi bacterium]|nr:winged helix-turn-helix transcriptional regulator [Chloroflexota bacterium]
MNAPGDLLHNTIEKFWDTIPSVWGYVRGNVRANAIKDFSLTLIQFHILRHVCHGIDSVGELAEKQQISRPAISQAVDLLVEKGLVERRRAKDDRRYVHIDLTEAGSELLNSVFKKNRLWMAEQMAGLDEHQLQTIINALDVMKDTFVSSCN